VRNGIEIPYVIGVTGDIACGKSTVLGMLGDLGAETIDADRLYHQLIQPGMPLWTALRRRFGDGIIASDGTIDRKALGRIVFEDPVDLVDLDRLTHPAVIEAALGFFERSSAQVVAIDAVKLVESGMAAFCHQVWLVRCDREVQLQRLIERNDLSYDDASTRIGAQPDRAAARARADVVIDNCGSLADLRAQVDQAWSRIPILQS